MMNMVAVVTNVNSILNMMIKKILTFLMLVLPMSVAAQSAKVVVEPNGNRSIYIGESRTQYHVSVQDDAWIPKRGCRVIIVSAAKGQGYLEPRTSGPKYVRQSPSTKSRAIARVGYVDGDLPTMYRCMGIVNGWYKIKTMNGRVGYVPRSQFTWYPIQL